LKLVAMRLPCRPRLLANPLVALLGSVVTLGACDGCKEHKPYTPYTLGTTATTTGALDAGADDRVDAAAEVDAAAPFVVVAGAAAPGDGKTWPLAAGQVRAPAGLAFTTGLVVDVDGDGKSDLFAWARSADGLRGELWFAHGSSPATAAMVAALPSQLGGEGCTPSARLEQIGAHTITLDHTLTCAEPTSPAPPLEQATRWLAVVDFAEQDGVRRPPELRLELRLKSAPAGETLLARLEARDEDADGREDLVARLSLEPSDSEERKPSALLRFFDRPAGLARDPSEPEASLLRTAEALAGRARRAKTAPSVIAEAHALRRLREALCGAAETRLVQTSAGPIHCGPARSLEAALLAQGLAALALGDWAGALGAAALLDAEKGEAWRRRDLDKALAKAIPARAATVVHRVEARPASGRSLRFDVDDTLIVRTLDGAVRVFGASYEESDPREEDPLPPPATPTASIEPTPSAPATTSTPPTPPMPTATSPDGKTTVTETPRGLLVTTAGRPLAHLLTGSDAARAAQCAPANGGERLACVIDGAAVILR
jgi:hypothetical protein